MSTVLECRQVCVDYGPVRALVGVDLTVESGETLAVLGPSGAGKTTLVHAVAGFVPLAGGEIRMSGSVVADRTGGLPPDKRQVGVVFQNYALWPHLDALDNVAYPLRRAGAGKAEARLEAAALMERLGLRDLEHRRPAQLSGGQQQRVGMARALARRASLFLFDEPTAHLDATVRTMVQAEIARVRRDSGAAAIYSSHDAGEALAIADRVALLRDGSLVQIGAPAEVYEQPVDEWAARLTGPVAVLEGESDGSAVMVKSAFVETPGQSSTPGRVRLLVRPDWVSVDGPLPGEVEEVMFRGPYTDYRVRTESGILDVRLAGPPRMEAGARRGWSIDRGWVLGADAGGS
jgi:iron(III) transport system ATP-binding protein